MFLSRIWFVLVGLLAGVGMTAAFVAPRPADRRIEQLEGQRLDRAQYAAEQMLKTDAHRWIDYVAKLGRDAVLTEALDSATRGAGEARMLHETVSNRIKVLVPDLGGIGIDTLIAVDNKGRVVARVGFRENEFGDAIGGLEVVADALRGYLSDDVWGANGRLQRVAAAPVLSKTRDRMVGALVVAAETGKRLAEIWKKNLGVDVTLMLRKQVQSSTLPEALVSPLPDLVDQRQAEIAEAKRSRAISLPAGTDRLLAVAAPFAGSASVQDAYYVLIGKQAPASNPWGLLSSTTADDLKWGNFPWLALSAGLVIMLGVGLFLQRYEMVGPLRRLRDEVQKLARGEVQKIDDVQYGGNFGGIARDVNAAMERHSHGSPSSRPDLAKKDLNAILDGQDGGQQGQGPDGPPTPFDMGSHFPGSPSSFSAPHVSSFATPPPPHAFPGFVMGAPTGVAGSVPMQRLSSPPIGPARTATPPPPPRTTGLARPPTAPASLFQPPASAPPSASASHLTPAPLYTMPLPSPSPPVGIPKLVAPAVAPALEAPVVAAPLAAPPADAALESVAAAPAAPAAATPRLATDQTQDETYEGGLAPSQTITRVTGESEDDHLSDVFADYLQVRERCGEPVGNLTFDKFKAKLEANRQQLIAKYSCRTARFSVYIKDGKAAIKATPIRD